MSECLPRLGFAVQLDTADRSLGKSIAQQCLPAHRAERQMANTRRHMLQIKPALDQYQLSPRQANSHSNHCDDHIPVMKITGMRVAAFR
jgi:hypothetical protein